MLFNRFIIAFMFISKIDFVSKIGIPIPLWNMSAMPKIKWSDVNIKLYDMF